MGAVMARSLAGHDKGKYYVIVGEESDYVYLADGELKSVAAPKRKNRRHVQLIKRLPDDVKELFQDDQPKTDLIVKRAIRLYRQSIERDGTL